MPWWSFLWRRLIDLGEDGYPVLEIQWVRVPEEQTDADVDRTASNDIVEAERDSSSDSDSRLEQ